MSRRSRDGRDHELHYMSERKNSSTIPPPHQGRRSLPRYENGNGHRNGNSKLVTKGIQPEGESGRRGFNPWKFLKICFKSSNAVSKWVNLLWPFVPAAIAIHFARPDLHVWIFVLNYIAMVPAANLLGFSGQEFSRKLPRVLGIVVETTLGSVVEIILFMVLIVKRSESSVQIIRAAILGSILANMLLCLGFCFLAGGMRRDEQIFHEAVSEVGSGLMLVAAMGLILPAVFGNAVKASANNTTGSNYELEVLKISRATSIVLILAYVVYIFFQTHSHHSLYDEVLLMDEHRDADRHKDMAKEKLTFTECIVALLIALACVSLIAVFLVEQIHYVVHDRHISDAFVGLILVPLVEKFAEHLTAIDEAWDNQMNFALVHVLGSSIQTALFNTPLVVFVGWGLGESMDLNFEVFDAVALILAVLVVGNFLRDQKSNYLEGVLCIFVYVIIAICAYYYPNPPSAKSGGSGGGGHH